MRRQPSLRAYPGQPRDLVHENVPLEQIYVTGNTGIDALEWAASLEVPFEDDELEAIDRGSERVVVTAHRRENWGDGLLGIATGVARLAEGNRDAFEGIAGADPI
jgi:UDP-N-acetylglucosamine 2-epimerase (non-hydrolysing)